MSLEIRSWGFVKLENISCVRLVANLVIEKWYIDKNDVWTLAENYDVMIKNIDGELIVFVDILGKSFRQR